MTIQISLDAEKLFCPVCRGPSSPFRKIDGFDFFTCTDCEMIHLDAATLRRIDAGETVFKYETTYWLSEMVAARERAYGVALIRAAEAILCCRRPVRRFLDIGTGPGTFLDAIAEYLPHSADRFHAIELFPPSEPERTTQPNYRIGRVGDYPPNTFDAGICIEVFEHLTPAMVNELLGQIARVAADGACFLINTGLARFVHDEVPSYLDPVGRGHITIWTVAAVNQLAKPYGLIATAIPARNWCFLLEKSDCTGGSIRERAAAPLADNLQMLNRPDAGASPIALLGETGLREANLYAEFLQRTEWALALDLSVRQLNDTLTEQRNEAVSLRAELNDIRASTSWRLTAGLRRLKRALHSDR